MAWMSEGDQLSPCLAFLCYPHSIRLLDQLPKLCLVLSPSLNCIEEGIMSYPFHISPSNSILHTPMSSKYILSKNYFVLI